MKLLRRILPKEAGQVLPMALILMVIGALVIIPTLNFATTNLKATQEVDQHTRELYAADAGIADALWYLQGEERVALLPPPDGNGYVKYDLKDLEGEEYGDVNNRDVQVSINHAWLLKDLPGYTYLPQSEPVAPINANSTWTVLGAINIDYTHNYIVDISTSETSTAYVDHIGVWLPQGYSYADNVTINGVAIGGTGDPLHLVKNPGAAQPFRSGNVLIWDYSDTTFQQLSDITPGSTGTPHEKFPKSIRLSFDYTVTPFKEARGFYPWIYLSTGSRIAWDSDAGFYHVVSTSFTPPSDNTTVEAYVPKGVIRYVSGVGGATSAIQGDYIAIGNSLMTCCWDSAKTGSGPPCNQSACSTCCGNNPYRNYAPQQTPLIFTGTGYSDGERESSATVSFGHPGDVPSGATIERAYLYWTAWLRGDKVWTEKGQGTWQWTSCMDDSDANKWENCSLHTTPTVQYVKAWLAENAYDGNAYLAVNNVKVAPINAGDPAGTVVASTWYISQGSSNVQPSYQYSCFADVTAQVKDITPNLSGATFTVAGVHAHPAVADGGDCTHNKPTTDWSRSANAGWSMVIIYSSAEKETHQIYLYEGCEHLYNNGIPKEFTIAGFATPSGDNEAKMTVFASEGDVNNPPAEYLGFKGQQSANYYQLYDVTNTADVFNSISNPGGFTASAISMCGTAGTISGIDIDTYTYTHATVLPSGIALSTIVQPGDTSANIKAQSLGDGFEIIYVVFSVRSTAIPAGTEFNVGSMMYRIQ
jgi:hypothetical protein